MANFTTDWNRRTDLHLRGALHFHGRYCSHLPFRAIWQAKLLKPSSKYGTHQAYQVSLGGSRCSVAYPESYGSGLHLLTHEDRHEGHVTVQT